MAAEAVAVHSAQREAGAKLDAFWGIDVLGLDGLRSRRNSCLRTTTETADGASWRFTEIEIAADCTSVEPGLTRVRQRHQLIQDALSDCRQQAIDSENATLKATDPAA